jgi:hypothetical protein
MESEESIIRTHLRRVMVEIEKRTVAHRQGIGKRQAGRKQHEGSAGGPGISVVS